MQKEAVVWLEVLFGRPPGILVRITFTAHGLNTFRQDRQLTTHQDGARFYGTLYMGVTRDANGVELVTVDYIPRMSEMYVFD